MEVPPRAGAPVRLRRDRGRPARTDVVRDHRPGREARPAATRRATWPSSAATCCDPRDLRRAARRPEPGRGGEIQLTDALQDAGRRPTTRAAACTASCSAAGATTPATGSTTSRPWCSSACERRRPRPGLRAPGCAPTSRRWAREQPRGWTGVVITVEEHLAAASRRSRRWRPIELRLLDAHGLRAGRGRRLRGRRCPVRQLGDGRVRRPGRRRRRRRDRRPPVELPVVGDIAAGAGGP